MVHMQKAGSDVNVWSLTHNDFHNTLLGGHEIIKIEKNGNNPPTVKQYSRFSVYSTSSDYTIPNGTDTENLTYPQNTTPSYLNAEAIYESADVTFAFGGTVRGATLPSISDGTWYLYCSGGYDLNATSKGQGVYNVSKTETPTFTDQKGGWYSANGYRVLCSFIVASSVVTNIFMFHSYTNRHNVYKSTVDYTATLRDEIIIMNGPNLTLALPAASTANGITYYIKNENVTNLTIDGNASETLDGSTTLTAATDNCYYIACDGIEWFII